MVFVGNIDRGYFIEEYCKKRKIPFFLIEPKINIETQVNEILEYQKQDYTIFDIEQYIDEPKVLAEWIGKICSTNCSSPIIFAPGYRTYASVITALADSGVKYFVFSSTLSDMKDEFEKCLNGFYDANPIEIITELQEEEEKEQKIIQSSKSIAIAGACNRIGTTTVAMQFVKWLQFLGKKVCYIHMNNTDYINGLQTWYEVEHEDKELGCVTYQGVDHFYKMEKIKDIMQKGYEYLVYDYGCYFSTDFNRVSFLEKDTQVFVVGIDQSEMQHTRNIIDSAFYDSVNYIFNFTAETDRNVICEMMDDKADKTFFIEYVPEKYVYVPNDIFSRILPEHEDVEVKNSKKKKGFFKRRKS